MNSVQGVRRIPTALVALTLVLFAAPAYTSVNGAASASVIPTAYVIPAVYRNCTALNQKYPHGIGKLNARDKTSGRPVTTFLRNTRLYNFADTFNGRLDGDNDGIACEKK